MTETPEHQVKLLYSDDDPRVTRELPYQMEYAARVDRSGGVPSDVVDVLTTADRWVPTELRAFIEGHEVLTTSDLTEAIEELRTFQEGLRWRLDLMPGLNGNDTRRRNVNTAESAINILQAFRSGLPDDDRRKRRAHWYPDLDIKEPR